MPAKYADVSKINRMGFKTKISLDDGIKKTIKEYENLINEIKNK